MRVPRVTGFAVGLPVSLAQYLICSEYATLKFLETPSAYYEAWTGQYLALIANGQLYPRYPVEAYLIYRFPQDNVTQLSDDDDDDDKDGEGRFYLKHVDDKGDHLMVDQDSNITGIIDWQMARIVPRREAFSLALASADMTAFGGGDDSLSGEDVALADAVRDKRPELARVMGDGKMRRFLWGLGLEAEWAYALPIADAILRTFGVEQDWDEWENVALRQYAGDRYLKALLKEDEQGNASGRSALPRLPSVVSGRGGHQVALVR